MTFTFRTMDTTSMSLTPQQRQHLKGLAHPLKPIVMIGQNGLTASVLAEIEIALENHELIKVRISGAEKEDRNEIAQQISQSTHSDIVQQIGHILVLFRKSKKQKIQI